MRRTAGAARPASAALIRRRRDGDPPTLRDSLIYLLLEGVACARDARNLALLRQPSRDARARRCGPLSLTGAFVRDPIAPVRPGGWSVANAQSFPGVLSR